MDPGIKDPLSGNDCSELVAALQADLSWEWDSRFETALAQISIEEKNGICTTLEKHMGTAWDSVTIDMAPERMQRVIGRLGGIMPGQLLYTVGLPEDGVAFCAWWPWGNGKTISIRFGTNQEGSGLLNMLIPPDVR